MKPETRDVIKHCLKYRGGRSRPDKSAPAIIELLKRVDHSKVTILDVGCGQGSFAEILRSEFGQRFVVDGVDIFNEYVRPEKYRNVFVEDFRATYRERSDYDIYLFVDVLEHFERERAIEIVSHLKDKIILASIPNAAKHWHQDERFEKANPHEAHLYDWTDDEVESELGLILVASVDGIGVYSNV